MYVIETYFIKDLVNIIDQRIGKVKKSNDDKKMLEKTQHRTKAPFCVPNVHRHACYFESCIDFKKFAMKMSLIKV